MQLNISPVYLPPLSTHTGGATATPCLPFEETLLRPAGRCGPSTYPITAFALGPGTYEVLQVPCMSEVSSFRMNEIFVLFLLFNAGKSKKGMTTSLCGVFVSSK